jgi:two-component system invasion response regulator UvrY
LISVLLADDQPIFREGVKRVLERAGDITVAGEAGSLTEVFQQLRSLRPDVVVMDLPFRAHEDGLAAVRELTRQRPLVRILILTSHCEDHFAVSCLKHGADGYMMKDAAPQQLISAIRKLQAGGKYLTAGLAEQLVAALKAPERGEADAEAILSRRQREIMRLLGSGLTPTRIASELHLSVKTISTHRTRILQKLHLSTTAELMRYSVERELATGGRPRSLQAI